MKGFIKKYVSFLLFLSPLLGMGQIINISFTVATERPLSRLSELQDLVEEGKVKMMLTNLTNQRQRFQIEAVLFSNSTSFKILTNPNVPTDDEIEANTTKEYDIVKLKELFREESFITGDGQSVREYFTQINNLDGQIPTGVYQLCVRLRPQTLNQQLTNVLSNTGCSNITFQQFTAPLVNQIQNSPCPFCTSVQPQPADASSFPVSFTPPVFQLNNATVTDFKYTLYIVEMIDPDNQDENELLQAVQNNTVGNFLVRKEEIMGTGSPAMITESLQPVDFAGGEFLKVGHTYMLAIKATTNSATDNELPNRGFSPAYKFIYGEESEVITPDDLATEDPNLPNDCTIGNCNEITIPTGGTAVSSLAPNDVVYVGCHKVKIVSVSGNENGFNGEGLVSIPLYAAKFKVKIVGLKVNNQGTYLAAIAGEVIGMKDASLPEDGIVAGLYDAFEKAVDGKDAALSSLDPEVGKYINEQIEGTQNKMDRALRDAWLIERTIRQVTDESYESGLPIGYAANLEDGPLRIGIFGLKLTPTKATMQLILQTPVIPSIDQSLYFGAMNACFSPKGLSLTEATFYLGGDLTFTLGEHKLTLTGSGSDSSTTEQTTFIKLTEGNIEEIKLTGEVELNNTVLIPKPPATGNLKIKFETNAVKNFGDLILTTTAETTVALAQMKSFGFVLKGLSLDLSTTKNPDGMALDRTVINEMYPDRDFINTWTGIHVQEVGLVLPSDFNFGNVARAPSVTVKHLMIGFETSGVSFNASYANIFTLNDGGKLGGMGFSMDSLNFNMISNRIDAFYLKGKLRFGLFDEGTHDGAFPYKVDILKLIRNSDNSSNGQSGNAELALAFDFELDENVELEITKLKTKFTIGAGSQVAYNSRGLGGVAQNKIKLLLNGTISIVSEDVNLPDMHFENFVFEGHDLKLDDFTITFASPQKFVGGAMPEEASSKAGGFPITIEAFHPILAAGTGNNLVKFGFGFDIVLNLKEQSGFGLTTGIEITTQLNSDFEPEFDIDVAFKKITIDADVSVAHVSGFLEFIKDDPKYGNGFQGCINIEMKVPAPITGQIQGMFGTKVEGGNTYRYFYIEGLIKGIQGAIIPGTPIAIDGFAGGFWYNMTKAQNAQSFAARLNADTPNGACNPPELIPSNGKMGIALGVMFKEAASGGFSFNGMMAFEAQLTTDLAPLTFTVSGAARFVKMPGPAPTGKMEDLGNEPMKIAADMSLTYDFTQNVLSGDFNVYLKIGEVLRGKGANDRAGKMVMYFGANDWYIYLGNPWGHTGDPGNLLTGNEEDKYASLEFKLGSLNAEAGVYFCMGTYGISGLPPLPPNKDPFYLPRSIRNASEGNRESDPRASQGGIAFGAYVGVSLKADFLLLELDFQASFGFDLALIKYSSSTKCGGKTIGINGAYARGRIYGYAAGEINVVFEGFKYNVFELKVAFYGEFGGPNPSWVEGFVEVGTNSIQKAAYKLSTPLGGAIDLALTDDETIRVEASVGTQCTPSESRSFDDKYGSFSPISAITPSEGGTTEPFGSVSVSFNKRLNATWNLIEPNQEAHDGMIATNRITHLNQPVPPAFITHTRRWFISSIKVLRGTTELMTMTNKGTFSTDGKEAQFLLYDPTNNTTLLRAGDQIKFQIKLGLEELDGQGNRTKIVARYKDGSEASITRDVTLTISQTSFEIANSDVAFCYPMNGQKYFLKGESNVKRFIKLSRHLPEMVAQSSNHKAKIYADNILIAEKTLTYQKLGQTAHLMYDLPTELPTNADIRIEFFTTPRPTIDGSMIVTNTSNSSNTGAVRGSTPSGIAQITGITQPTTDQSVRIYAINFRTSRFNTFADKMASVNAEPFKMEGPDSYDMTANISTSEPWDDFEIYPNEPHEGQGIEERYYANRRGNAFKNCIQVTTKLNTAWHNGLIPIYDEMIRNIGATSWEEYASVLKPLSFKIIEKNTAIASIDNSIKFLEPVITSERFEKINNFIGLAPLVPPRRQMAEASRSQARETEISFGNLIRNSPDLVVETGHGLFVPKSNSTQTLFIQGGGIRLYHRYNDIVRRGDITPTAGDYQFTFSYRTPSISMTNGEIVYSPAVSPVNITVHYDGYDATLRNQQTKSKSDISTVKSFR